MPDDLPRRAARPAAPPPEGLEETVVHVRPSEARRGVPVGRIVAATAAACVLLAAAGIGYFVYQDRQDRAARAAYAVYESLVAKAQESRAVQSNAMSDEPLSSDVRFQPWKQQFDKLTAIAEDDHVNCLALEAKWRERWRRLGLRSPLPLR